MWPRRALRAILSLLVFLSVDVGAGLLLPHCHSDPFFKRSAAERLRHLERHTSLPYLQRDWTGPRVDDGTYVVGVFGGSVAFDLARFLDRASGADTSVAPIPALTELAAHVGARVRFVNLALSGAGYPAQYNLLHLGAHQLDAALFLDGFNEQFVPSVNCRPSVEFWDHFDGGRAELLLPYVRSLEKTGASLASPWQVVLMRSGIWQLVQYRRSQEQMTTFDEFISDPGGLVELPPEGHGPIPGPGVNNASWADCVTFAHEYGEEIGLPIYFFVQPNMHVRDSKPFTDAERLLLASVPATSSEHQRVYDQLTEHYDDLDRRVETLRERGVRVVSLRDLYRDVPETVYRDFCCHLNDAGNARMAAEIASVMRRTLPAGTATSVP